MMDASLEVIHARRTESLDAPEILKLAGPTTERIFGRVNVVNIIEKANLAVTLVNAESELLAHGAFFDYPNIPDLDQTAWEEWLRTNYDCSKSTALNTLFMNYFVAKSDFALGCAKEILRTVFNAVPYLQYVFLVVPKGIDTGPALSQIFKPCDVLDGNGGKLPKELHLANRHEHCPALHIRKARVEDHDDLTPIFNRQNETLSSTYGEFFLAELIEADDEENKCIVADVNGTAVGFMSVCSHVDTDLLNQCFELGPFNGLRKRQAAEPEPEDEDEYLEEPEPTPEPQLPEPELSSSSAGEQTDDEMPQPAENGEAIEEKTEEQQEEEDKVEEEPVEPSTPQSTKSRKSSKGSNAAGSRKASEASVKHKLSDEHMRSGSEVQSAASSRHSSRKVSMRKDSEELDVVPVFEGEESAFCIQLFCIDEKYEMRSLDFLPAAFQLFPDKEYCVLTMPHLVPEFPLVQGFTRVTPRLKSTLSQELYVFHRWGLLQSFKVRPSTYADTKGIRGLVRRLNGAKEIMKDIKQFNMARRDKDGTEIQVYVAECLDQIIGVAVIRREEDIEFLRAHYNIEDFIYYNHHLREEHGHLHHFALNPIFQNYSKHFLKEVLRQSHKSCLYYPIFPAHGQTKAAKPHSIVSALNDFVPIRARRQIEYPEGSSNGPSERVSIGQNAEQGKFALNHLNRKLTLEPKVTINARIVVVGASDVGVSFLETLVFCPHLRFNNITVISPHGLPGHLPPNEDRTRLQSSSLCYNEDNHHLTSLRSWVNVVEGKMLAIDRTNNAVQVTGSHSVPYDYLILCTGQQYQVPVPSGVDISTLITTSELPPQTKKRFDGPLPSNVYTLNTERDYDQLLAWVKRDFHQDQGSILVYGDSLEAYCMIGGLLRLGLLGSSIVMVQPPPKLPSCFNNPHIEKEVEEALASRGVALHVGYTLAKWNDGTAGKLTQATFTSNNKPLSVNCSAFLCFQEKHVDFDAFKAINDSCLVYDGKLVVDSDYHTNDNAIRAAGPLTKFARRYHAENWSHANFNSKEVGHKLAQSMLTLFDPTLEGEVTEPTEEQLNLVPVYEKAKGHAGFLPGGLHYVHFGKPALKVPLDSLMVQPDYGRELVTQQEDGSYFRLHVNQYKAIETVTCLSRKPIDVGNIQCLYGLHERYCNNLLQRYDEGIVKDFYTFFREPWCMAIFHDRFSDFRGEIRELLVNQPAEDVSSVEEKVRLMIEEDLILTPDQRTILMDTFKGTPIKRNTEQRILNFLSYNSYHLPMYARPGMV